MPHGGDIYRNEVELDFSVSLNPVPPPDAVIKALQESLHDVGTYPDLRQTAVKEAIAMTDHVTPEEVLAGNGASELLFAVIARLHPRRAVLVEPGFYGYRHALAQQEYVQHHRCGNALHGTRFEVLGSLVLPSWPIRATVA